MPEFQVMQALSFQKLNKNIFPCYCFPKTTKTEKLIRAEN